MTTPRPRAHDLLAARRRRVVRLRQAVLGIGIALFIALFATIYVQMATGHDPALSASSAQVAAASTASSGAEPGTASTTPSSADSTEAGATDTGAAAGSDPAPVTTAQS